MYKRQTYNLAYQKYDRHCTCHHISTKALKSIILKTIQETCHYVSLNEREFVYSLQEESAMKDIAVSETVKNRIERNQKRVHELDMLIRKIYEDNVIGRLPDRLFQSMLTDYENEQNELNKIIETDTADMQRIIGGQNNVERFLKLVKKYENITELTPAMINEFKMNRRSGTVVNASLKFCSVGCFGKRFRSVVNNSLDGISAMLTAYKSGSSTRIAKMIFAARRSAVLLLLFASALAFILFFNSRSSLFEYFPSIGIAILFN